MARPVSSPPAAWPLEMRAETAAAYCDESSVHAFLIVVRAGEGRVTINPGKPTPMPDWTNA